MRKWIVGVCLLVGPAVVWSADQSVGNNKELDMQLSQFFAAVDTNNSGKVSRAEAEVKAPAWTLNFDAIDANHDGELTKAEIKAYGLAIEKKRVEFGQYLVKADKDKNGMLSREEANAAPKSRAMLDLGASFDEIDSDHNGQLVVKEISAYIRAKADAAAATRTRGPAANSSDPLQ
jgi:Ca2+-binding EF-hand superfamily protein